MIGAFARMFRGRVTEISEEGNAYEVKERSAADFENAHAFVDGPPEAFVDETLEQDGNKLYVIPFMEAFREWTRKLAGAESSADDAEDAHEAQPAHAPERADDEDGVEVA